MRSHWRTRGLPIRARVVRYVNSCATLSLCAPLCVRYGFPEKSGGWSMVGLGNVPRTFANAGAYVSSFQPLLLDEARCALAQSAEIAQRDLGVQLMPVGPSPAMFVMQDPDLTVLKTALPAHPAHPAHPHIPLSHRVLMACLDCTTTHGLQVGEHSASFSFVDIYASSQVDEPGGGGGRGGGSAGGGAGGGGRHGLAPLSSLAATGGFNDGRANAKRRPCYSLLKLCERAASSEFLLLSFHTARQVR